MTDHLTRLATDEQRPWAHHFEVWEPLKEKFGRDTETIIRTLGDMHGWLKERLPVDEFFACSEYVVLDDDDVAFEFKLVWL